MERSPSIVVTAAWGAALMLILAGLALVFVLPFAGVGTINLSGSGVSVQTTNVGLALIALGCGLVAVLANALRHVQVFGPAPASLRDRVYQLRWVPVVVSVLATVALLVSIVTP